ncbi:MAG TPA: glycosyltransferase [Thermoanaerobaculia bacterium]
MRILTLLILAAWVAAFGRLLLNLLLVPRLRVRSPRRTPFVSLIVPARDEERTIERAVRAFLGQTYRQLEVIVVNDRSTDHTGQILASIDDPRLVVITGEDPSPGWLGKPWALAQGSRKARGELLLFVDADVVYAPEAVEAAVAQMEESGVAMLSLFPRFEMHGFWEHVAMPNLSFVAFTILPLWLGNRTRLPILGAGGGPGNLVRREVYDQVGGHEALRDAVIDDVALARLVRRGGHRSEFVRGDDFVSVRMYHGLREVIEGFTKNSFSAMNRSYVLAISVALGTAVFHLLPYVWMFTGELVSIATVVLISLVRLILYVALGYRVDNALFGHPLMMAVWGWITLRSVWYTGIRRQVRWRGRTYDAKDTRFGAD